jgi:ribonuclease E
VAAPEPEAVAEKPKRVRKAKAAPVEAAVEAAPAAPIAEEAPAKPKRTRKAKVAEFTEASIESAEAAAEPAAAEPTEKRGGWWQRTFGAPE